MATIVPQAPYRRRGEFVPPAPPPEASIPIGPEVLQLPEPEAAPLPPPPSSVFIRPGEAPPFGAYSIPPGSKPPAEWTQAGIPTYTRMAPISPTPQATLPMGEPGFERMAVEQRRYELKEQIRAAIASAEEAAKGGEDARTKGRYFAYLRSGVPIPPEMEAEMDAVMRREVNKELVKGGLIGASAAVPLGALARTAIGAKFIGSTAAATTAGELVERAGGGPFAKSLAEYTAGGLPFTGLARKGLAVAAGSGLGGAGAEALVGGREADPGLALVAGIGGAALSGVALQRLLEVEKFLAYARRIREVAAAPQGRAGAVGKQPPMGGRGLPKGEPLAPPITPEKPAPTISAKEVKQAMGEDLDPAALTPEEARTVEAARHRPDLPAEPSRIAVVEDMAKVANVPVRIIRAKGARASRPQDIAARNAKDAALAAGKSLEEANRLGNAAAKKAGEEVKAAKIEAAKIGAAPPSPVGERTVAVTRGEVDEALRGVVSKAMANPNNPLKKQVDQIVVGDSEAAAEVSLGVVRQGPGRGKRPPFDTVPQEAYYDLPEDLPIPRSPAFGKDHPLFSALQSIRSRLERLSKDADYTTESRHFFEDFHKRLDLQIVTTQRIYGELELLYRQIRKILSRDPRNHSGRIVREPRTGVVVDEFIDHIRGLIPRERVSLQVRGAAALYHPIMDAVVVLANGIGLKIQMASGGMRPFVRHPNFFPIIYKPGYFVSDAGKAFTLAAIRDALIKKRVGRLQKTMPNESEESLVKLARSAITLEDARRQFNRLLKNHGSQEFGFYERLDIDPPRWAYQRDLRAILSYGRSFARRAGAQIALPESPQFQAGLDRVLEESKEVGKWIAQVRLVALGKPLTPFGPSAGYHLMRELGTSAALMRLTGASVIANLSEPAKVASMFGVFPTAKVIAQRLYRILTKASAEETEEIRRMGILYYESVRDIAFEAEERVVPYLTKFNKGLEAFLEWNFFGPTNRWSRKVGALVALDQIPRLHQQYTRLLSGWKKSRVGAKLKEFGIDPDAPLTREALERGVLRASNILQGGRAAIDFPLWAASPAGQMFLTLRKWSVQHGVFVWRQLIRPAFMGDPTRLLRALWIWPLVGEALLDVKTFILNHSISGKEPGDRPPVTDFPSAALRYFQDITFIGGFGVMSDIVNRGGFLSKYYTQAPGAQMLAGLAPPFAHTISDIAEGIGKTVGVFPKGKSESFLKIWLRRAENTVPFIRVIRSQIAKDLYRPAPRKRKARVSL